MPSYDRIREEIKSRVDIVDLISGYVSLKKSGQNWKGLCPFHSEKTPSFIVSPSKQIYHCFGCGIGGDVFSFIMQQENTSFNEAISLLAKKAGVTLPRFQDNAISSKQREILLSLYRDSMMFYRDALKGNPKAEDYLKSRGIDNFSKDSFFIGYASMEWDRLLTHLKGKGYPVEAIKKAGLIIQGPKGYYDTFRGRIIFPIFDLQGEVAAFGGRVLDNFEPKYLNSPETLIFNKSRTLYGLNLARDSIKKMDSVIFVEGYLDVISCHRFGFTNVVAPLGTALTEGHAKLMKRFTDNATLVFDSDEAGIRAAKRALSVLFECNFDVRVLLLPRGEDPDSFLRKKGAEAFKALVDGAKSFVDFFLADRKKDGLVVAREALDIILKIPDRMLQGHYIKALSEKLKINELFLREELKRQSRVVSRQSTAYKDISTKAGQIPKHEEYILQLILKSPERARLLSEEDFDDPVSKNIFKKIKGGLTEYSALISQCDGNEKALLAELFFKEGIEDQDKTFEDCLHHLKSKRLACVLQDLQDKIKEAESRKDGEALKALLLEKQKLLKEVML